MKIMIVFLVVLLYASSINAKDPAQQSGSPSASLAAQLVAEDIATSKLRIKRLELDEAETIAVRNFKKAQRDAVVEEYQIRRKLYERQLYYHPIVLATVIVIVLTGIIFCGIQVWRDINSASLTTTTFKISKDGLELSSSVVGLISLGLSFLFFYLYVTSIYQISDTSVLNPHNAAADKTAR